MAAEQVRDFLEQGNIQNSVNFPDCKLAPTGRTRITLINNNVPKVISRVTTLLGEYGLNIDEMLNKNRGEVAYNIIDVSDEVPEELVEKLRQVDGVVAVRIIPDCN
jgi:D-3-phosphoglycerate dehydrogenase